MIEFPRSSDAKAYWLNHARSLYIHYAAVNKRRPLEWFEHEMSLGCYKDLDSAGFKPPLYDYEGADYVSG